MKQFIFLIWLNSDSYFQLSDITKAKWLKIYFIPMKTWHLPPEMFQMKMFKIKSGYKHHLNTLCKTTRLPRSWCHMKFPILFLCFRQPFLWERIFLCRKNQDFIILNGSWGLILHALFLVSMFSILFALLMIILSYACYFDVLCYSAWKYD